MKKPKPNPKKAIPRVCSECVHHYAAHSTSVGAKDSSPKQHLAQLQKQIDKVGFDQISTKNLHTAFIRLAKGKHHGGLSHRTLRRELNRAGLEHVPSVIAYRVLKLSSTT